MTIEQLQAQIDELKDQINQNKSIENIPPITIQHHIADEGKVFKRDRDGTIMGKELHLGYDYSIGFRRIDKIEFYSQIPDPEVQDNEGD